ncbi:hypothetical protein F2Q70_00002804 [Brassica cretica]|uniref:Uncharacterized protein n=1 Tax=Brassica cretica TaxID=69181 RepID=A0A8S9IPN0_BRACR|nr:hypothetical protein F2Q70_00002804 [Brassica cretica]
MTCPPYSELVCLRPAHHMASWYVQGSLTMWRAGPSDTRSPYGEMGRLLTARHMASRDCTLSMSCILVSSSLLPPSSCGYIVSCFVSIGVTVEILR